MYKFTNLQYLIILVLLIMCLVAYVNGNHSRKHSNGDTSLREGWHSQSDHSAQDSTSPKDPEEQERHEQSKLV